MRKITSIFIAVLLILGMVSAHPFSMEMLHQENTDHLKQEANLYAEMAPEFLGSLVGDQVINIRITSNKTTKEIGVMMNGTNVEEVKMENYNQATLEVNTSEKQLKNITAADQPIQRLNQKLQNGDIEYDTKGTVNSIRTFIAKQLLTVSSFV